MRRGPKPAKAKVEAKPSGARKSRKNDGSKVRNLEKRLAEAQRREAEALEQQTATSEILRIISGSPADAQPVFDAIAVNALRLFDAKGAVVMRYDGDLLYVVAHHNVDPEAVDRLKRRFPEAPERNLPTGRAVLDGAVVHVPDFQAAAEFSGSFARQSGARSHVSIPLLHRGRAIGAIGISRPTLGPFSDRQIAMLQTFADQAVIAIENVRLFKELQARNTDLTNALARQTATSDILHVISSSPTDVQPVFDAIIESAGRLCEAVYGGLVSFDGELMHLEATHNWNPEAFDLARDIWPARPSRAVSVGRAILERAVIHVPDVELDLEYVTRLSRAAGFRSVLTVPMVRDGVALGAISVGRAEPGPFSDSQIALLQTFADQAVIAIENVRLFTELQTSNRDLTTALDKQTATSDILAVISRSQTDVQPVFDAILVSAVRLLGTHQGALTRVVGDQIELAASTLPGSEEPALRAAAVEGSHAQVVRERTPVNIADMQTDPRVSEGRRALARAHGYRSLVAVPLLRQDEALGAIAVTRPDPGGFADDEIALLQTFADQAVIAIENVRLFTELQEKNRALTEAHGQVTEALDQQTATSEILGVISQSPTDVQPVFEAIIRSATQLCAGLHAGVLRYDGDMMHLAAHYGYSGESLEELRQRFPQTPGRNFTGGRAITERRVIHIPDLASDPAAPVDSVAIARIGGYSSLLAVPMMRGQDPIGCIVVSRGQAAFSDKQIELVKTFADQAVIAIENVRLFTELQASNHELTESLAQQTATAEILRVISSSPTDLQPVFDTVVRNAVKLCSAASGGLHGSRAAESPSMPSTASRTTCWRPSSVMSSRFRFHVGARRDAPFSNEPSFIFATSAKSRSTAPR